MARPWHSWQTMPRRASATGLSLKYDAEEKILFVDHPTPVALETAADVDAYFDAAVAGWRRETRGERVYFVVSYEDFSAHLSVSEAYAARVAALRAECALNIVRYGGDVPQRTTARRLAIMMHVPSRLYATREEAIQVVRGLRNGSIKTGG
jgi:hypothetical protein